MNTDFYDRIMMGVLVLVSPVWLPLWVIGWAVEQAYDVWIDLL